jgi:hypothetical protein
MKLSLPIKEVKTQRHIGASATLREFQTSRLRILRMISLDSKGGAFVHGVSWAKTASETQEFE